MDLKHKLPLAFGLVLLLTIATGSAGLWLSRGALQTFEVDVQHRYGDERRVAQMEQHFKTQVQEWKNALLRGSDAALLDKHWAAFEREEKAVADGATALLASLPAGGQHDTVERFIAGHRKMAAAYREGLEKFKGAGMEASVGDLAVRGVDREPSRLLESLQKDIAETSEQVTQAAAERGRSAARWSAALMLLAGLGGVVVAVLISRQVSASLQAAISVADRIAQGHLDRAITTRGSDEIARLLGAMAHMQEQLRRLVDQVRHGAEGVAVASSQIAQGNGDLAQRTEQQASALQMTASSMEQLGSTVRQNAEHAREASRLASDASEVASQGGTVVGQVVQTMQGITESSRRIADIIGVIDGIAFQTNILALNAAVEAARAGELGRGFAVVAGEVRSLAQRSGDAAREIKGLIQASVERVEQGNALVGQAGATMDQVVGAIGRVHHIISEISHASEEQSQGVGQVAEAVSRMDESTQQNAALVEQTSAASENLNRQAGELVGTVAAFKV